MALRKPRVPSCRKSIKRKVVRAAKRGIRKKR